MTHKIYNSISDYRVVCDGILNPEPIVENDKLKVEICLNVKIEHSLKLDIPDET